jgi:hypothetical protein
MSTIVIMPGGFHPFHTGHAALYQSAVKAFPGAEVFVAATNDTSNRPFPFAIKEKLAKLAGVKPGHFVQVKSPFRAEEITSKFDPDKDRLIFVRSEKDAAKPPQAGGNKKDGSPAYLQPLAGQQNIRPFKEHAYMAYLPTVEFGPGMTSATEIRTAWPKLNDKRKTALVMSLYPQTQQNPALAANVVAMLDTAIGTELNEFAPGGGSGESGRWYTDDQMTDIVGDGWWNDLDISGNISKQQMIREAQAWLDDQGYSVQVLNCRLNDDDMDWYIEGSFHNPGFAKKGMAESNMLGHVMFRSKPPKLKKIQPAASRTKDFMKKDFSISEDELSEIDAQNSVGGMTASYQQRENQPIDEDYIDEKWSQKYKSSINCASPKGFSQRAHCAGRKK